MKVETQEEILEKREILREESQILKKIIFYLLKEWTKAVENKEWDNVDVNDLSREIYENRLTEVQKELSLIELALKIQNGRV